MAANGDECSMVAGTGLDRTGLARLAVRLLNGR